jgi:hypothetical protein
VINQPQDGLEERNPLFTEGLSNALRNFLHTPVGVDALKILRAEAPTIPLKDGIDAAALAGAQLKGWNECIDHLERMKTYTKPSTDTSNG